MIQEQIENITSALLELQMYGEISPQTIKSLKENNSNVKDFIAS